ncbi:lipocalin family protein [Streptomyces sp. NPDC090499]|uniref:lipocalin family protein n=1 Tax=unclassified Streptomyces TaxID=2593676 RepID=UPI0038194E07
MKMKNRTKLQIGTAVATAAVLGATGVASAAAAAPGIPTAVDVATDLAAHTPGTEESWNDSIYITSEVRSGGHDYGVLVHVMDFPNTDTRKFKFSVTDEKTGWYKNYVTGIDKGAFNWSKSELDIKAPGLTWTGDANNMSINVDAPFGSFDVRLKAKGPVLNYAGTGTFDIMGAQQFEFGLPSLQTSGTLKVKGETHRASGETWLDRQWGPAPQDAANLRWTWMNLNLPNGDKVAIWNPVNVRTEEQDSWATVLHPNGSYDLAAVKPLADGASGSWSSSVSGNTYPTRWRVEIPSLNTDVSVRLTGTPGQELNMPAGAGGWAGGGSTLEATASFSGTYEGKKVNGKNYVEMAGNWK